VRWRWRWRPCWSRIRNGEGLGRGRYVHLHIAFAYAIPIRNGWREEHTQSIVFLILLILLHPRGVLLDLTFTFIISSFHLALILIIIVVYILLSQRSLFPTQLPVLFLSPSPSSPSTGHRLRLARVELEHRAPSRRCELETQFAGVVVGLNWEGVRRGSRWRVGVIALDGKGG
jgi:hypothetical protein